jgi:16S rRNA (guanine527-N7)-methyltransferase
MDNRIAAALEASGIILTAEKVAGLAVYLEELLRWNRQINLTAIQNDEDAIEKHIIDSLLILKYLGGREKMLDVGSGAGLPGVPLALALPEMRVVSVDSSGKKINFQKHIKRKLQLGNFEPINQRIEQLQIAEENSYDLIVSRAFSSVERFVARSLPFQKQGGLWVAMKGPEGEKEAARLKETPLSEKLRNIQVFSYNMPISLAKRTVILAIRKASGDRGCN